MDWTQTIKNAVVFRLFDRAFNAAEAWIERELREEDGMGNETEERCGNCTGCGCPSRCEEEPLGASLQVALQNRAEIAARETPELPKSPPVLFVGRDGADVAELNRLRTVEADLLNECERLRKKCNELQAAKSKLEADFLHMKVNRELAVAEGVERRLAALERFPYQDVLDRLRSLEERLHTLRNEVKGGRHG